MYDVMIFTRSTFNDGNSYYPWGFLEEFVYRLAE